MYVQNKIAYDFNGLRIWNYRHESDMIAAELAAKAQTYLTRYFKAVEQGRSSMAEVLLNAAESYYKKAASRRWCELNS